MKAAPRRAIRRGLLRACADVERQRLTLADAQATRAIRGLEAAATATAGAALLAGVAIAVAGPRPRRAADVGRRWAALAVRAAGWLVLLRRAVARRGG